MNQFFRFAIFFCLLLAVFAGGHHLGKRSALPAQRDTIRLLDTCFLPGPTIEKEILVPVPADVDTAAILSAHFTKRVYHDEIINTPMVKVSVVDTVYQNTLLARTAYSQINLPVRNNSLSIGLTMVPQHTFVSAVYRHKRWSFEGGWDFVNKEAMVSAKFELFKW